MQTQKSFILVNAAYHSALQTQPLLFIQD